MKTADISRKNPGISPRTLEVKSLTQLDPFFVVISFFFFAIKFVLFVAIRSYPLCCRVLTHDDSRRANPCHDRFWNWQRGWSGQKKVNSAFAETVKGLGKN